MPLSRLLAVLVLVAPTLAHAQPRAPIVPADRGVSDRAAPDLWLATPEGFRALTVTHVNAQEGLGAVSEIFVSGETLDTSFDVGDLLGELVTLGIRTGPASFRVRSAHVFGGSASRFTRPDGTTGLRFDLELRSWLAALTMTASYQIFERATVLDAVRAVFARYAFARVEVRVARALPVHAILAQYRESDLTFVTRMLASEGLHYRFEYTPHGHTLVVSDSLPRGPARSPVFIHEGTDSARSIYIGGADVHLGPSAYRVTIRDAQERDVVVERSGEHTSGFGPLVVSDHLDLSRPVAERIAAAQLAGMQAPRVGGSSASTALEVGSVLALRGHPTLDGAYRVARMAWTVSSDDRSPGGLPAVNSSLSLLPQSAPFALPMRYGPEQLGPQRAVVVAPPAGERAPAEHARVRFRWAAAPNGEMPTAWVPVMGGPPPRPGDTVLVTFLDGDPSAPIIVASAPSREPAR